MSQSFMSSKTTDLPGLSIEQLSKHWRQYLSDKVPEHLPKALLSKLLSYRVQADQNGGLSKRALAYLKTIEDELRSGRDIQTPYPSAQKLKSGCQLVREYGGVDHRVNVIADGYEWEGQTFKSLSAVAKAITGTNWNGHRFFGLKAKHSRTESTAIQHELGKNLEREAEF